MQSYAPKKQQEQYMHQQTFHTYKQNFPSVYFGLLLCIYGYDLCWLILTSLLSSWEDSVLISNPCLPFIIQS